MFIRRWKKFLIVSAILFFIAIFILMNFVNNLYSPTFDEGMDEIKPGSIAILILSSFGNHVRRQTIRDTWLRLQPSQTAVRHFFVIAVDDLSYERRRLLLLENSASHDLLLLSGTSDDYQSLTQKVKMSIVWLHKHLHPNFHFMLKVDDDSFVQLPQLSDYIEQLHRAERLYLGFFYGRGQPRRHGRWKERNWFLCQHYLPHAHGGGYVITRDLSKFITDNVHLLSDYANEDISIGTWLAPLDILRLHEPLFDTEYKSRGCNNRYLISHKISTSEMTLRYSNLLKHGRMCSKEKALYPSYRYNWSVNPLECCHRAWNVP